MGIKVSVIGAAGKMGKNIINAIHQSDGVQIVGAVERRGNSAVGKDSGEIAGAGKNNVIITDNLENIIKDSDVTIDFTSPESTVENIRLNEKYLKPAVIGTTGFSTEQRDIINDVSKKIPILLSPNMSIGVNLLFKLVQITAQALGKNYDVEIVEMHHRFKKDAPSGTAKKLGEIICNTLDIKNRLYGREGFIGERTDNEIGIFAVRAGDIVGEHTVIFSGIGERIELTHRAHSRMTFAQGAVKAAIFIIKQKPGLYSMLDVLQI